MNAVKSTYKDAPNSIPVPEEFQHKNIEVIFLPIEEKKRAVNISSFYGALPNFPERESQGKFETRETF